MGIQPDPCMRLFAFFQIRSTIRIEQCSAYPSISHAAVLDRESRRRSLLTWRFPPPFVFFARMQVKASNRYTLEHFDQDLRTVMWRVGVQGEQVCFIFDESNVLSPAFLER